MKWKKILSGLVFILLPGFIIKENIKSHPYLTIVAIFFGGYLLFLSISPFFLSEKPSVSRSFKDEDIARIATKINNKKIDKKVNIRIIYSGIYALLDTNSVNAFLDNKQIVKNASHKKGFDTVVTTSVGKHKVKIDIDFTKTMIPVETYEFDTYLSGTYKLLINYTLFSFYSDSNWKFTLLKIEE